MDIWGTMESMMDLSFFRMTKETKASSANDGN